jgi:hypothetical protein
MQPPAQEEAPQSPAVPPFEPSVPMAALVGSGIFACIAVLLGVLALLPGSDAAVLARLAIPGACLLAALALKLNAARVDEPTLYGAADLRQPADLRGLGRLG